jgi:electron transfer flavoprotein beta subunit
VADDLAPLVVACVEPADLRPRVDPLTGEVATDPRLADLAAPEAAAVEHVLRIADQWEGHALVVAAGPAWMDPSLRRVSALGARVLRVPLELDTGIGLGGAGLGGAGLGGAGLGGVPLAIATALVGAIRTVGEPALVVCGDRSASRGVGAVPAFVAHLLGAEQALGVVSLVARQPGEVRAERRLDGGWRERLTLHTPAVCSVEAAGVRLRRAPFAAALSASKAAVPVAPASALPPGGHPPHVHFGAPAPYVPRTKRVAAPVGSARDRLLALTGALASHDPPRVVGPLEPSAAALEILRYLSEHGYRPQLPPGTAALSNVPRGGEEGVGGAEAPRPFS